MADWPYGRIRVREDQAKLLFRLLWEERARVSRERFRWKGQADATHGFNRAMALIDATREELQRLADEKGWELYAQPEREDPQAADPGRPDPSQRELGGWEQARDRRGRGV